MVIPCLCSFLLTVPSSAFSEPLVNKKRTRTLFRKESGSSTNCMVGQAGLEPASSDRRVSRVLTTAAGAGSAAAVTAFLARPVWMVSSAITSSTKAQPSRRISTSHFRSYILKRPFSIFALPGGHVSAAAGRLMFPILCCGPPLSVRSRTTKCKKAQSDTAPDSFVCMYISCYNVRGGYCQGK